MTILDLEVTYDPVADAAYVYLRHSKVARSLEISEAVRIDLDSHSRLIGVEMLYVTKAHKEISPILKKLATKYRAPALRNINPHALTQVYAAA